MMGIIETSERRHLQLVATVEAPTPVLRESRWLIDLRRFPYRPGEMPESLVVSIPTGAGDQAQGEGLPLALWARIAIEVERAKERVVELTQRGPRDVDEQVRSAADAMGTKVFGVSPLARYASAVLGAGASEPCESPENVEVFIPSEMALGWREAAAVKSETLEAWMRSRFSVARPASGLWRDGPRRLENRSRRGATRLPSPDQRGGGPRPNPGRICVGFRRAARSKRFALAPRPLRPRAAEGEWSDVGDPGGDRFLGSDRTVGDLTGRYRPTLQPTADVFSGNSITTLGSLVLHTRSTPVNVGRLSRRRRMPVDASAGAVAAGAGRYRSCTEARDSIGDHFEPVGAKGFGGADVSGKGLGLGVFGVEAADAEEDDRPIGQGISVTSRGERERT